MLFTLFTCRPRTGLDRSQTGQNHTDRFCHFSNEEAGDLKNPDKPLVISSDIDFTDSVKSDLCYIKPVVFSYFDINPFSAVKRKYIIEMPYRMDNVYLLSLDIPTGYTVEEMPASAKTSLNDKGGYFEYILEKNGDMIQLRMRIKIDQTLFTTEEYGTLREFVNQILKKENEQIVFRKLK